MLIEQIVNIAIILGVSLYVVLKDDQEANGTLSLFILGAASVLSQFVFNILFQTETIRLDPLTTKDILLVRSFSFDVTLVVVGYIFIAVGLFGYLREMLWPVRRLNDKATANGEEPSDLGAQKPKDDIHKLP